MARCQLHRLDAELLARCAQLPRRIDHLVERAGDVGARDSGQLLERAGLVIAGTNPEGTLVEIVELADHPWFVAVQFHPEFKSKPTAAHPLFAGLVAAAVERHAGSAWVAEA